jgi:hypothetical protein
MTSSGAEVIVVQARHVIAAKAADVISTKTSDATAIKATHVTSAEATHVTSAEATHVASTEAAHVTSAEAASTVSSAAATTTTAGLCIRGKQAAGKHRACQNHHHSSSHDILHLKWAGFPPQVQSDVGVSHQRRANVATVWRWECLFVVSTKFVFIWTEYSVCSSEASASAGSATGLGAEGVRNQLVLQMRGDFSFQKKRTARTRLIRGAQGAACAVRSTAVSSRERSVGWLFRTASGHAR